MTSIDDNNNNNPNKPQDPLIEKNRRMVTNNHDGNDEKLEINDESNLDAFEEFDGVVHIDLDMLLPK
jgi:hypothetical protein